MLKMQQQDVWLGTATLLLGSENPKRLEGFIGAFSSFACSAGNIVEAMKALHREFEESGYILVGVENMVPVHMLDRQLTAYETELVEATSQYPVQFKNVHLHKGDG
jgi:hypothetical protein